jgi:hypothetical protein
VRSSSAPSKTAESDDINRQDSCEFSSFETLLQGATGYTASPTRNVRYLRNLAVPSKSRNFRFGSEPARSKRFS